MTGLLTLFMKKKIGINKLLEINDIKALKITFIQIENE